MLLESKTTRYIGGTYWLLPQLNVEHDVLGPIMLWWCLSYVLSHLARYHPAEWTAALDPNDAATTVPTEEALSFAMEVVPRLVFGFVWHASLTADAAGQRQAERCVSRT